MTLSSPYHVRYLHTVLRTYIPKGGEDDMRKHVGITCYLHTATSHQSCQFPHHRETGPSKFRRRGLLAQAVRSGQSARGVVRASSPSLASSHAVACRRGCMHPTSLSLAIGESTECVGVRYWGFLTGGFGERATPKGCTGCTASTEAVHYAEVRALLSLDLWDSAST